ncbi:hypothetical protein LJR045_003020 [Microbacterium sp. LjRoot45]|uniref:hypothetical protein n=1 Tax=Microbacterium sp. LjRoot45 TaxID=3342329 RepID=UPI003ECE96DC
MADESALVEARELLARAHDELATLHARAPAVAAAVSWRSPSAAEFADAFAEWVALLSRVDEEVRRWDAVLAARAGAAP